MKRVVSISVFFMQDKRMEQQFEAQNLEEYLDYIVGLNKDELPFDIEDYHWTCKRCNVVFESANHKDEHFEYFHKKWIKKQSNSSKN